MALSASCASHPIPEFKTYVTLPASGDGHGVGTLSHEQVRIPKAEWDEKKKRGIILFSEDWEKIKFSLLKACHTSDCNQVAGSLDGLFKALDDALGVIQP